MYSQLQNFKRLLCIQNTSLYTAFDVIKKFATNACLGCFKLLTCTNSGRDVLTE